MMDTTLAQDKPGFKGAVAPRGNGFNVSRPPSGEVPRRILEEVVRLGLERNVLELDLLGYTILTPEQTGAGDLSERLRAAVLDAAEKSMGVRPGLDGDDDTFDNLDAPIHKGVFMRGITLDYPAFRESLVNPAVTALTTYLLGEDYILNQGGASVKGRGGDRLGLHSDNTGMPAPFTHCANFCNATWVLTDYSIENGCLTVVEGSHRYCRQPTAGEDQDLSLLTPVIAPAGSVILWHGHTWHAALPRTAPGVRLMWTTLFSRWYFGPLDPLGSEVTQEMVDEHPQLATIMGLTTSLRPKVRQIDPPVHNMFVADQFSTLPW